MRSRLLTVSLTTILLLTAAPKKNTGTARGENQDIMLDATIYVDGDAVKEVVGNDLDGHFVVAMVKITPKFGKEITIDRDDFLLRTDKDGDRTKPMAPSQIAGRGGLSITSTQGPGGEGAQRSRGWSLGGIGMGGGGGVGAGGGTDPSAVKVTTEKTADADSPLKKVLDEKVLAEKKTTDPVSGLLYFPMEKQRLKDLELYFGGRENKISLRFK